MSFITLPVAIRKKIYRYAGLVRPCTINVLHESSLQAWRYPDGQCTAEALAHGVFSGSSHGLDCHCPALPVALLRVSQKVHEEALSVLYGGNDFLYACRTVQDLCSNRRLPLTALGQIRSLLIRLNCWPCPTGHDLYAANHTLKFCSSCKASISDADSPISLGNDFGNHLLTEWAHVCAYLSKAITPGRVHLSLIADVEGECEAHEVVTHLRKLPQLDQLDLKLGRKKEASLRAIAKDTVDVMIGKFRPAGVFTFEKLPPELQWRILELTDLVPSRGFAGRQHSKQVRYIRKQNSNSSRLPRRGTPYQERNIAKRNSEYHEKHAKRTESIYIRENKLSSTGRHDWIPRFCCRNCTRSEFGCCCHTVFAAVSAYCICRRVPFELFYVNKAISQMAMELFYSTNKFVFQQSFDMTTEFLKDAPLPWTKWIREISIVPQAIDKYAVDSVFASSHVPELRRLFDTINEKLDMSKLTVTFSTKSFLEWSSIADTREDMYEEHKVIARCMQTLRGAHRLRLRVGNMPVWNAELARQVEGGEPLKWSIFAQQVDAW